MLVGDHEQLQAIGAGAPFRAIAEAIGHAELSRYPPPARAMATCGLGGVSPVTARTEGLQAYQKAGAIEIAPDRAHAEATIVRGLPRRPGAPAEGSRVVLAHRRADVRALNDGIRAAFAEAGRTGAGRGGGERAFATNDGERRLAPEDRWCSWRTTGPWA